MLVSWVGETVYEVNNQHDSNDKSQNQADCHKNLGASEPSWNKWNKSLRKLTLNTFKPKDTYHYTKGFIMKGDIMDSMIWQIGTLQVPRFLFSSWWDTQAVKEINHKLWVLQNVRWLVWILCIHRKKTLSITQLKLKLSTFIS